ncbi:hypothetical protein KR200_004107 [Drosophila serrata]|nr:hypothetical protein KR200_004107 [Drosophila serrata]
MPSHSVMPSPIASRLTPGRAIARSAGMNIKQRLGEKLRNTEVVRRSLDNDFIEWRNDRRVWNDNISDGPGLFQQPLPPPPPEILDWNTQYRRRDIEAFRDFNDHPPRVCEPEYNNNDINLGSERFSPNDFHRPMEQFSNPPPQGNFSSGGYPSFEGRRGDSDFMESFNDLGQEPSFREDIWKVFESPVDETEMRRRDPSPRGPIRPAAPDMFDKVFHIGGYKLPFVTNGGSLLSQSEAKSFLCRFLKKIPTYRISTKKGKARSAVEHVYVESVDVNEFEDGVGKRFSLNRFRDEITKELTKVYRGRMYRNWDGWWKDFHSINLDIDEELGKFEDFNVMYNFMPPGGTLNFVDLLNKATIALTKNRNNYLGNMRVVYGLMNHTILGNMPMEIVAKLQDLIRSVPNHLWIYKLRCVIYLWYNYKQVMTSNNTKDTKYHHVLKEWKSPVIHWVAKEAFIELRNISYVEFPDFRKLYGKNKDTKA